MIGFLGCFSSFPRFHKLPKSSTFSSNLLQLLTPPRPLYWHCVLFTQLRSPLRINGLFEFPWLRPRPSERARFSRLSNMCRVYFQVADIVRYWTLVTRMMGQGLNSLCCSAFGDHLHCGFGLPFLLSGHRRAQILVFRPWTSIAYQKWESNRPLPHLRANKDTSESKKNEHSRNLFHF